ncbi:putative flagellar calcium-binding protein calflagin [Lupinus albus]|uniref:Putative flagellar calcium-binding protein calflagin n=1 Tax=Lupinus albus TaxID=3870 RepID=A0A6A4QK91_LUPAL|nr:putative flagellar calcium-binding protein calflagin [Lupinus albus]
MTKFKLAMAIDRILKPSKWFSNKNLGLNLHRQKSRSSNSTLNCPRSSSPVSSRNSLENGLTEAFRHFDRDGDGKISAFELRSYFGSIGEYVSHEEVQGIIHDFDSDGDNMLDFKDFIKLLKKEGRDGDSDEDEGDLRKAFEMFVWEKEGFGGCITPKGLQRMLHRLGYENYSYDECVAMINAFDIDHNGVLDFNEFHQMMA